MTRFRWVQFDLESKRGSSAHVCLRSTPSTLRRGSYRGIPVMRDWLILFSVKREFNNLFFVIRDLKVLRDPWRTWIINRYSWFHHSIWRDFEMRVLRKTYFLRLKTSNVTSNRLRFNLKSNPLCKFTCFTCLSWIRCLFLCLWSPMSLEVKGQWSKTSIHPRHGGDEYV